MDKLIVRGAREHNLKNIDLEIPRDKLVVITGLSGSGKSSLAFDTIYAEGQRRYVESLSAYARQFLGLMEKPDVDQIEGLSPAISIDQRGASRNPRSTVGTITEIYDYLRLLFARIGVPHCPNCGREISAQTVQQIVDSILEYPEGSRLLILAPLVMDRKGEHKGIFEDVRKAGFVRVRVDGQMYEVETPPELDRYKNHTIEAVVDRLIIRRPEARQRRCREGPAGRLGGDGAAAGQQRDAGRRHDRSRPGARPPLLRAVRLPGLRHQPAGDRAAHLQLQQPARRLPHLHRPGQPDGIRPRPDRAGQDQEPGRRRGQAVGSRDTQTIYHAMLESVSEHYQIPFNVPVAELSKHQMDIILYGGKHGDTVTIKYVNHEGHDRHFQTNYEGVIPNLQRRYRETTSDYIRGELERFMTSRPCPTCGGKRLRPEALAVTIWTRTSTRSATSRSPRRWVGGEAGGAGRISNGNQRMSDAGESADARRANQQGMQRRMTQCAIRNTHHAHASRTRKIGSAEQVPPARRSASANTPSPARSSRSCTPGCASWWMSGWTTCPSTAWRPPYPAARRSASAWRRRSARSSWACSTSWTSRASACTSATTPG